MRGIQFLILRFGLFFFFAALTSPIAIVADLLMQYCDAHEKLRMFKWVFAPVLLGWLIGLAWLTNQVAHHMAFEDQKLGAAVRLAFYDFRLKLAFLPLVGHWFESHSDQRETDDDEA